MLWEVGRGGGRVALKVTSNRIRLDRNDKNQNNGHTSLKTADKITTNSTVDFATKPAMVPPHQYIESFHTTSAVLHITITLPRYKPSLNVYKSKNSKNLNLLNLHFLLSCPLLLNL